MPRYRDDLPQLAGDRLFLADGGLETSLIFSRGIDLRAFAAFELLKDEFGRDELRRYFTPYLELARARQVGFVLDTATWRASPDWAHQLGFSNDELKGLNRRAVELAEELRARYEDDRTPIVLNGAVGPRGDGYDPAEFMSAEEARLYHAEQIETFAASEADMVSAITMTYVDEAIGIVRAATDAGMPVAVSFTVETDGRLPSGQSLAEAIEQTDSETARAPAYFMINCAHPEHFASVLADGGWRERIAGLRANASTKSHAELDESEELDAGDPVELSGQYRALRPLLPRLNVLGGCCGTDDRHIAAICSAWGSTEQSA